MATTTVSSLEHSFRVLIYNIADKLTPQNCRSLRFIYKVSTESQQPEVTGLDIMKELMTLEQFHYMHPETLENCLAEVSRQDLVNLVRKYKKSDEYKAALKQEGKKTGRKGIKSKVSDDQKGEDKLSSHNLPFILMHTAQTVGQTKYFLEAMTQDIEQQPRRREIVVAVDDIKRDFERLGRSLNKAISLMTEPHSAEILEVLSPVYDEDPKVLPSEPKPIPLPKPRTRMSLSATQPNLSSLAREMSDDTQDYPSSSAASENSRQSAVTKSRTISGRQNTYSGDSGYSGSSCHSTILMRSRSNPWKLHAGIDPQIAEIEEQDHTYDVPKSILQNLPQENSESVDDHIYANT